MRKWKRLKSTLEKIDNGEKALGIINEILREKEKDLEKINSGEDYYKARKKVKLLVGEFLSSKTKVIALSVTSIITALQKDPDKQIIIDHILNPLNKKNSNHDAIILLQEKLRKQAERIYYEISDACTDNFLHP